MAASDADGSFVPSSGGLKDTTHIAVIDADGNVFDATPSGGWTGGGVILGETGIGLSTRGEQFWLDPDRANQIRPRARPRYTLTPSIVFKDGEPLMAIGTPGGDNQDQTILQSFLNVVEFWSKTGIRICTTRWRGRGSGPSTCTARSGRTRPASTAWTSNRTSRRRWRTSCGAGDTT